MVVPTTRPDLERAGLRDHNEKKARKAMTDCFKFKNILDNLHEGVYCVDLNRKIRFWNKGAERITGYTAAQVTGSGCGDNILVHIDAGGKKLCHSACPLSATIKSGQTHCDELIYLHHADGHRVPVAVSVSTILDDEGQVIGAIEIFKDNITEVYDKNYIEDLKRAALLDHLTGLPNRRYLEVKLHSAFAEMQRHATAFGLLLLDLDHFKQVNDTFGHQVGDQVLQMVARTLQSNTRAYNLVSRWGGEEFLALINHIQEAELRLVAEKYRALVANSFLICGGQQVSVTATVGCTMARPDDTPETLLARADRLLYGGKRQGRNCLVCEV